MADIKTFRPPNAQVTNVINEEGDTVIQTGNTPADTRLLGDVSHTDGDVVLNVHADATTPASFKGDILNSDDTIVLNVGSDSEVAVYNGDVTRIPATETSNMQVDGTRVAMKIVSLTEADYADITTKETNTLYLITENP